MLGEPKLKILLELIRNSTREELAWMNGYLNGLVKNDAQPVTAAATTPASSNGKITIAYGTETGNSKKLAAELAAKAKKNGINAKVVSLDQYRLNDLAKEEYFLTVISTQGEGEPPAAAKRFYDHIHNNGFRLDKLKYSVLALGDTSYPLFCKAGEDVDTQLQKLGGQRLVPIQKCDLDYDTDAHNWFETVLKNVQSNGNTTSVAPAAVVTKKANTKKTYTGTVLTNINLNDKGSAKSTYHIEIAAEGLEYEPGDSIGIVPKNPKAAAKAILSLTNTAQDQSLTYRDATYTALELLEGKLNISHLTDRVIKRYAAVTGHDIQSPVTDLFTLLKTYPLKENSQLEEVLGILNPIAPRLYTVASAPAAHNDEMHITVALDRFAVNGEQRLGVCSEFLRDVKANDTLSFFVQKNKRFKLPAAEKDIIMIGPGTGIAAFRSFIAERDASGASGQNWLFFGEQHFATDFLYQTEIQGWLETGVLTRVNVAFSRDQVEKVYVQHKISKYGQEFYQWLQNGAYLYICGSKKPMSIEVEQTILAVIEIYGGKTKEEASQYLSQMEEEGRYSKDVY